MILEKQIKFNLKSIVKAREVKIMIINAFDWVETPKDGNAAIYEHK